MNVCIYLRNQASKNLRAGNLRGEPRWERQVLEATLSNPLVTSVYTAGNTWAGSHPKYRGKMVGNVAKSTVLIVQDWNNSAVKQFQYAGAIVNIFAGPWDTQMPEIKEAYRRYNGHLYLTIGFPVIHKEEIDLNLKRNIRSGVTRLTDYVPAENLLSLPNPGAPNVVEGSNFDKKRLLWAKRCVHLSELPQTPHFLWAMQQLKDNPELYLDVLIGWDPGQAQDYIGDKHVKISNVEEAFWKFGQFSEFGSVRNRVIIHPKKSWEEVLGIYKEAKLLITVARGFGGPPIEAGMHGIPMITGGPSGAMALCSEALHAHDEDGAIALLSKLNSDREYYNHIGNSYREYVRDTYTFEAFNNNLNNIIASKGIL